MKNATIRLNILRLVFATFALGCSSLGRIWADSDKQIDYVVLDLPLTYQPGQILKGNLLFNVPLSKLPVRTLTLVSADKVLLTINVDRRVTDDKIHPLPFKINTGSEPAICLTIREILSRRMCAATYAANAIKYPPLGTMLRWSEKEKDIGFQSSDKIANINTRAWRASRDPLKLPYAPQEEREKVLNLTYVYGPKAAPLTNTVTDYMIRNKVAALLVLKDGKIALELYSKGTGPQSRWESMSIAKSVDSLLVGVALKQGLIKSIDEPIEKFIPELRDSAYAGVTLKQVLRMSSGVAWNDDYADPKSDIAISERECFSQARGTSCILNYTKELKRARDKTGNPVAPGTVWNYNSDEGFLVALAVERATGQSLEHLLEHTIWQKFGMESDATWMVTGPPNGPDSNTYGKSGLYATLRDNGRIGLFAMNNGRTHDGSELLPRSWMADSTTWVIQSKDVGVDNGQYGYFWWFTPAMNDSINFASPLFLDVRAPPQRTTNAHPALVQGHAPSVSDWTFEAEGIFGQMIAINPIEKVVVVEWSSWDQGAPTPQTDPNDPFNEQAVFVNAVMQSLH